MHKITKGLKKKKKGKKSKRKEDELFKPEELEAYRREHQQAAESAENATASGANEEWKKFNALTAGVDSILKKTQGDLNRIKSTSFFQRIPPPSELKKEEKPEETEIQEKETLSSVAELEAAVIPVSDSESEEEDEDDIFDTSYLDAIAAGEVKLAYIPESPTEQLGDDPFDTSIAERAILGPVAERKGKKLVPLGAAVEVLTGRVQQPTCATTKRPSTRRQILKEKNLLLGSFDDNANSIQNRNEDDISVPKTLLDDDAPLPLSDEPIDLSKTLHQVTAPVTLKQEAKPVGAPNDILAEFDVITKQQTPEDDDDKEFQLLAAESLTKQTFATTASIPPTPIVADVPLSDTWNAFADETQKNVISNTENEDIIADDPFDTTFAENILPGKVELKLIEKEILETIDDFDFNPRAEEKLTELLQNTVSIQVTNPSGARESVSSLDRVSEYELNIIQHSHRDLLGGSITDLSKLDDQPLKPSEVVDENYIEYSDPFDTSIVDIASAPGQAELKFLEKELLSDIQVEKTNSFEDDDFDPRSEEPKVFSNNNIAQRKVSFELPLGTLKQDLLSTGDEESLKISKPLTPYYIRENSITEHLSEGEEDEDPFDTSFVRNLAPGKAELKVIETELFQPNITHSLSDQDFNPRDDKQVVIAKVVQTIQEINKPKEKPIQVSEPIDLLSVHNEVNTKVLTPAASTEDIAYSDPFDTSIACNILPGKTELKLLESELIHSNSNLKQSLSDPDFNPRDDIIVTQPTKKETVNLLETSSDAVNVRPLTPIIDNKLSFELDECDIDPFDTSIANNIAPGRAELKLLETELI